MRVADFFCGGGGFSEGFRQAGFEIVFAVDKWAPAVNTYKGNKPGANVIQDDVIRISNLPDDEFEALVPDSEVIIGSPPCQSFSHSNKSGNADKELGIKLIEAYLKIVARKKFKQGSVLRYWVLENVPAVKDYIKDEYTAADFGLDGDFVLRPKDGASGKYNAKYYGAPTNRERYLCGEFPRPVATKTDNNITTLRQVLDSLGDPLRADNGPITDINYPDFTLEAQQVTDQHYIYELAAFECKTAKRLKQDKGYMGKMSFPENLDKPARTVMATMTASAREAMILGYGEGRYRLPTVREAACMMSFPIDYWFYGESKGVKHTLVGNAVPPKLSYAVAVAIATAANEPMSDRVCKEHGLSVVKNPQRHKTARSVYFAEKDGEPTRYNLMRRALDEALTISSSWTELGAVLRKKGYVFVCDPYRRYATIRSLSAKKCMRTFRLGAEYDKEALQDRLLENQRDIRVTRRYFEFMRPYTREYARKNPPTEEYYRQRDFYLHLPRVTGYLSFFRCVAIVLGVAPLYEKEYRQPLSAECREACRRLDRFTAEITLVCREHLDTPEDVQRFLARMDKEMDAISAARSKIRNKQRGCADPVERVELKKSCAACTAELSRLRKQKQTAYNMIEDNPKLKALLACELDAWVENDPYLSPREKQVLRNQQPSQEDKTIIR